MSNTALQPQCCVVCRLPLEGVNNVLFAAGGHPLFGAHDGECAQSVRELRSGAIQATRALVKARMPGLWAGLELVRDVLHAATDEEGQHGTDPERSK